MGGAGSGERFGRDEFITRVAQRERTDAPSAVFHARVVLEVIRETTPAAPAHSTDLPREARSLT